jgi:hypothetical protein
MGGRASGRQWPIPAGYLHRQGAGWLFCDQHRPACGSLVTGTAPTDFAVNLSDPLDAGTVQASDFTVNGAPADSFALSNGDQTITFSFDTSPVMQGENTMQIPAGAFTHDGNPVLEFNCTFRYAQEPTPSPSVTKAQIRLIASLDNNIPCFPD